MKTAQCMSGFQLHMHSEKLGKATSS